MTTIKRGEIFKSGSLSLESAGEIPPIPRKVEKWLGNGSEKQKGKL